MTWKVLECYTLHLLFPLPGKLLLYTLHLQLEQRRYSLISFRSLPKHHMIREHFLGMLHKSVLHSTLNHLKCSVFVSCLSAHPSTLID